MAKRHFQLTEEERTALTATEQASRDVHERRRLQALRLYGSGQPMATVTAVVGCSERSVRQWASQYREAGIERLRSRWRGGNANKLTAAQRDDLKQRLHHQRPHEVLTVDADTSRGQYWTVATLREALRLWYGLSWADDDSYRLLLRRSGFSPQRPQSQYRSRADAVTVAAFEAEVKKRS